MGLVQDHYTANLALSTTSFAFHPMYIEVCLTCPYFDACLADLTSAASNDYLAVEALQLSGPAHAAVLY